MSQPTESSRSAHADEALRDLRQTLDHALRGKEEVIENVLICLLARGHLLIEDTPGLGKTTLAKALATAIDGKFARIQCTPDLLPGDITGFNIFNQQERAFEFRPGPVFADVVLADEINRATPRTQSALLEVMAERQVTVDNVTRPLANNLFVVATQNPAELHGTFPLPEAQRDRFAMKLRIGYPDQEFVVDILSSSLGCLNGERTKSQQVMSQEQLSQLQQLTADVTAEPHTIEYLASLGAAVLEHPQVTLGMSPRALLIWLRCSQARALLCGREFVTPDDVQYVATPVLEARLTIDGDDLSPVIGEALAAVDVPVYR